MKLRIKQTAMAMFAALVVFILATLWGVLFAFPEPDASPEKAVQMQVHARLSGAFMLASLVLFLGALGRLTWHWIRSHSKSSRHLQQQ